jgi:hypothetical protein
MARQSYYPQRTDQLATWHQTFAAALAQHATALGIAPEDLTQAQTDAQVLQVATHYTNAVSAFAKEVTAWRDILHLAELGTPAPALPQPPALPTLPSSTLPAIRSRTKALVSRIRTSKAFNDAIARDLGLFGPAKSNAAFNPSLTAKAATGSRVVLRFTKGGYPAVRIECKRGMEQDWSLLTVATTSPFEDARPPLIPGQPEKREYRVQALDKNHPTGNPSGVVTVATLP